MTDDASYELVRLCDAILADDEVSVEEVVSLGQWLDRHDDARGSWTGALLDPAIQKILADGKVNKTELRTAARVVREVQKRWVKRQDAEARRDVMETARLAAAAMDPSQAQLPPIPLSLQVRSHSDPSSTYDVNLSGPTCACPDWRNWRASLPVGDLTRCCKHILDAFVRVRPDDGWPWWMGAFLDQGWKPHPQRRWNVLSLNGDHVLTGVGGNDWADVFSPGAGGYQRFGYNVTERRWSYGVLPREASEIARAIHERPRPSTRTDGGFFRRLFGM